MIEENKQSKNGTSKLFYHLNYFLLRVFNAGKWIYLSFKFIMLSKESCAKSPLILTILALLVVGLMGNACDSADQSICGKSDTVCQNYRWVNATCLPGSCPSGTYWSTNTSSCLPCKGNYTLTNGSMMDGGCSDTTCPPGAYWSTSTDSCACTGTNHWINGTCVSSGCPAETFWSNSTNGCIACLVQPKDVCDSFCSINGYFFSSEYSGCLKCSIIYGANCETCNASNCLSCGPSTQLDSNTNTCVLSNCTIPYCRSCSNSSQCISCQTGFSVVLGQCYCSIKNCQMCSGSVCLLCNSGFQTDVTRTTCLPFCIQNCISCSSYFQCTQCQPNYTYHPLQYACQYNCSLIDPNCLTCWGSSFCAQCASGYSLNPTATQCVKACSDGNCISCPSNISSCSQCISGWKVASTGNCLRDVCTISNCLLCNGASTCSECAWQYQLSSDAKSCLASCLTAIPNCEACSNATTCLTCGSGYTLSNSSCTPACSITNCLLCASKTTCMACAPGTLMGYSSLTCDWDCGINGCRSCSSATTCSGCYPGYTLSADSQHCLIVCPEGYYLKDGACTFCLGNYCQLCATTGQCLACRDLFYLNQTDYNCYQCSNIDLYCYTCQSTAPICTSCVEGFFLSGNKCVLIGTCAISHCAACYYSLNASTCLLCNPGYVLGGSNTTCSPISCPGEQFLIGSVCTCGIGAYTWNNKCKSCSKNCLVCNAQLCSLCGTGYYSKGTDCKKCSQNCQSCTQTTCLNCIEPYILHKGNCNRQSDSKTAVSVSSTGTFIACPAGCKTCDLSTSGAKICTSATDGYVLIGQSLSKCDPSCKTCTGNTPTNKNSNCLSCYQGSNIVGGNCKKCTDANALTCNPTNPSFSLTCLSGFTPSSGGVCSACSSNCVKCDINKAGSCDIDGCGTGFAQYGTSLLCVACFNGCAGCDSDPNTCTSCLESQYLSNGKCLPCSTNCLSCSNSNTCNKCQQGYTPTISGSCAVPPGLPCVNYDASLTCTACDTTYELSSGKCVVSSSCNSTSNCSTCNYNQYLTSGNCYTCPQLPNCSSCSLTNSSLCFDCNKGYYLDASSICVPCVTGCSSCASFSLCLLASEGYYAILTLNGTISGSVAACASNCLTCNTQATLCASCKTGFTLQGSQCLQDFNYEINIIGALIGLDVSNMTSTLETALFLQIFALFLDEVAKVLKFSNLGSFQQNSVFKSLVRGSLAATMNVNGGSVDSTSFDGLSKLSTVSVLNVNSVSNNSPEASSDNSRLVLILAITLPVVFFVIVIGIVLFKCRKSDQEDENLGKPTAEISQKPLQIKQMEG